MRIKVKNGCKLDTAGFSKSLEANKAYDLSEDEYKACKHLIDHMISQGRAEVVEGNKVTDLNEIMPSAPELPILEDEVVEQPESEPLNEVIPEEKPVSKKRRAKKVKK